MVVSNLRPNRNNVSSLPAYRKFQRAILAICLVLAPLAITLAFALDPQLGIPKGDIHTQIAAAQAVNPVQFQLYPVFYLLTAFVFPLSYLGLGLLAMKRAPWLATIGIAFGLLGSFPWPLFVGNVALGLSIVRIGWNNAYAALGKQFFSEWVVLVLFFSWVLGHLLGYLLLGSALVRARVMPLWAAWLLIISVPFQMVGYPTNQGLFQIIGFVLVLLARIPAGLALLQFRDEEAPGPGSEPSVPAS